MTLQKFITVLTGSLFLAIFAHAGNGKSFEAKVLEFNPSASHADYKDGSFENHSATVLQIVKLQSHKGKKGPTHSKERLCAFNY